MHKSLAQTIVLGNSFCYSFFMKVDYLLVGLGNPAEKYKGTRHNLGADFLHYLADRQGLRFKNEKMAKSELAFMLVDELVIALAVPSVYMNKSGEAVSSLFKYFEIKEPERMLLVHDELNLQFSSFKFSFAKSAGGHNGVASVIEHIKSKNFYRLRVGIGPLKMQNQSDFVLKKFSLFERVKISSLFSELEKAVFDFYSKGPDAAMNKYN